MGGWGTKQHHIMKNLNPISDYKKFVSKDGEILTPRFLTGSPRSYHLDLSKGCLNLDGQQAITKQGEPFKIQPIAIRVLEGALFGQEEKKWCEFYFVNEAGHLCMMMFHSYSLDNFRNKFRELYYEEVSPCDVVWTISLAEKKNKDNQKYYMAFFEFEKLEGEGVAVVAAVVANTLDRYHHINRSDTIAYETKYCINWDDGKTPTPKQLEEEKEKEAALMREFETKEEKETREAAQSKGKKNLKKAA